MPIRPSGRLPPACRLAAAALAAWLGAAAPAAAADPISGLPYVIDGDTLGFGDRRVRLYGIDAPEPEQTCRLAGGEAPVGDWATRTLRRFIGRDEVVCHPLTRPVQGQVAARCRTAAVPDLGRAMVAAGFAWDFKRQSHSIYEDDEAAARDGRLGVWAGGDDCPPPWEWRRR